MKELNRPSINRLDKTSQRVYWTLAQPRFTTGIARFATKKGTVRSEKSQGASIEALNRSAQLQTHA